jgi:probable rRNA maturation factor
MPSIRFFEEGVHCKLAHPQKTRSWIKQSIINEARALAEINFIFCSDEYLRNINIQFLDHPTYTDIITFDTSEVSGLIQGDIYISVDRVTENSTRFKCTFEDELHRVMIHGVLHLVGYSDKNSTNKKLMRKKEDAYLSLRK